MFTHYLIKVAWGGNARVCACVAINLMIAGLPNIEEVLLRKYFRSFFSFIECTMGNESIRSKCQIEDDQCSQRSESNKNWSYYLGIISKSTSVWMKKYSWKNT